MDLALVSVGQSVSQSVSLYVTTALHILERVSEVT